jgi:hypothetical protein
MMILLVICLWVLAACSGAVAPAASVARAENDVRAPTEAAITDTPSAAPTRTRTATATVTATATASPRPDTATPEPTAVRTATPTRSATALAPAAAPVRAAEGTARTYLPAVSAGFRAQPSLLGVALEGYRDEFGFHRALELDARYMRRHREISWREVEPREGEYHWELLQGLEPELLNAQAHDIEVMLSIQMTPDWAQKVPPYACGPIRADKFDAFAEFVEQLVGHFGPGSPYGVRYWQIANEPDVAPGEVGPDSVYGCWGDPEDPYFGGGHYAEMLKIVYPRAKAADPNAVIVMGGLLAECDPQTTQPGNGCLNATRWKSGMFLEGVMQAGGGAYFDVASIHSYAEYRPELPQRMHSLYSWTQDPTGGTGLPEKIAFLRRALAAHGYADKPVFAGEIALKCEAPTPECYDAGAAFVPRAYAEAYALGAKCAMYYSLINESKFKGLLLPDLTPKPAFWTYKFLSDQIGEATYEGPATGYAGVSGQSFVRAGAEHIQILWSADGSDHLLPVPMGFVAAYDKYGGPIAPSDGQLIVGWSPIYVVVQ